MRSRGAAKKVLCQRRARSGHDRLSEPSCAQPLIVGVGYGCRSLAASLGLGKYEAAFRENEITEKVLPNLTAEDLKELGVAALGHRRTLLDAIAALRSDASGKTPSIDPTPTSGAASALPEDRAERRQVTVMFASKSSCFHWEI
jgi:SAM domain (Sterile alpha motif)